MKKKTSKLFCLVLSAITIFSINTPAIADEIPKDTGKHNFTVYSPQFRDAYIIAEEKQNLNITGEAENSLGTVTAKVFVEEKYALVNGEVVTIDSHLLSKDEVDAIGVKNFEPLEEQKTKVTATLKALDDVTTKSFNATTWNSSKNLMKAFSATSSRGTLTITFSGTYSKSGTSVTCNLTGNASWSGFNLLYSSTSNPAVGTDFFGIAWSGGFSVKSSSVTATLNTGNSQTVYLSGASPSAGRVWEFDELVNLESTVIYVKNVNLSATLYKASAEGNGNTAEAVLKYIHTYQSTTGSIDISASSGGIGAGFSLSNTDKQWDISCVVTGFPY